ncbi:glycosyltransferase family 2 protein [Mucilaginibacter pedocola]|uniref:Glycosyltransferase n=1 Tax=Mucilaginibacter pedocola TaxID=1792845 RepID=A0A1S9PIA4_9SPHI|nr:glycosyltransferase family 2 protein [Mucilaginibacter pedocola]OOQ60686.1 glycosyltransferase [Mucilaginibacter pedocola]
MNAAQKATAETGRVSVIVVTYNAAATLQACLDSIFAQSYPDIEVVVIDGASTDGTVDILQANTTRIAYCKSEPDKGIYDAMNKALRHITGQWVYFLGADDELLPAFSDFASALDDGHAIYYANVLHRGVKRAGEVTPYYMAKVGIYHQSIIYPAIAFTGHQYDTRYRVFADWAFNMQCYGRGFTFTYRDLIIANYSHTGLSSHAADPAFERDRQEIILKNFGLKIWMRYRFRRFKEKLKKKS